MPTNVPIIFNKVLPGNPTTNPNQVYFVRKQLTTTAIITDNAGNPYPLEGYYSNTKFVPTVLTYTGTPLSISNEEITQAQLNCVGTTASLTINASNFDALGYFYLLVNCSAASTTITVTHDGVQDRIELVVTPASTVLYRFILKEINGTAKLLVVNETHQPTHVVVGNTSEGLAFVSDNDVVYENGNISIATGRTTPIKYNGVSYNMPGFTITGAIVESVRGMLWLENPLHTSSYNLFMAMGENIDVYSSTVINFQFNGDSIRIYVTKAGEGVSTAQLLFSIGFNETVGIELAIGAISIRVGGLTKVVNFNNGSNNFTLIGTAFGILYTPTVGMYFENSTLDSKPLEYGESYTLFDFNYSPFYIDNSVVTDVNGAPVWLGGNTYLDSDETLPVNGFKMGVEYANYDMSKLSISLPRPPQTLSNIFLGFANNGSVLTNTQPNDLVFNQSVGISPSVDGGYTMRFKSATEIINRPDVFMLREREAPCSYDAQGDSFKIDLLVDANSKLLSFYQDGISISSPELRWITKAVTPSTQLPDQLVVVVEVSPEYSSDPDATQLPIIDAYFHKTNQPVNTVSNVGFTQQRPNVNYPDRIGVNNFCYYNSSNKNITMSSHFDDPESPMFDPMGWEPTQLGNNQIRIAKGNVTTPNVINLQYDFDPSLTVVQSFFPTDPDISTHVANYDYDLDDMSVMIRVERRIAINPNTSLREYVYSIKFYDDPIQEVVFDVSNYYDFAVNFDNTTGTLSVYEYGATPYVFTYSGDEETRPYKDKPMGLVFGYLTTEESPNPTPDPVTTQTPFYEG